MNMDLPTHSFGCECRALARVCISSKTSKLAGSCLARLLRCSTRPTITTVSLDPELCAYVMCGRRPTEATVFFSVRVRTQAKQRETAPLKTMPSPSRYCTSFLCVTPFWDIYIFSRPFGLAGVTRFAPWCCSDTTARHACLARLPSSDRKYYTKTNPAMVATDHEELDYQARR